MENPLIILMLLGNVNFSDIINESNNNPDETLQLVHVIFRHGNRTIVPDYLASHDPFTTETFYPFGQGELTLAGKKNAFKLGLEIRNRYKHFLKRTYYPPEVQAITSNKSRTQMTLQSVLTAMYPPEEPYFVHPFLKWQPISYQILPTATDNLLLYACLPITLTTEFDPELQWLYNYVSLHSGRKIHHSLHMMEIFDTILVEKENGIPLPVWSKEIFNNGSLQKAALTMYVEIIEKKLDVAVGPIIKKITEDTIEKIKTKTATNIFLYSGHDINIAMLLGFFDIYSSKNIFPIEYLSHIYIELHKIGDMYGFKVFFKNGLKSTLEQVKFRSCTDDFCPIDKFIESTKYIYTPPITCL